MVAISWAWYNGLYTMVAKPIKSLELYSDLVFIKCSATMTLKFSYLKSIKDKLNINSTLECDVVHDKI